MNHSNKPSDALTITIYTRKDEIDKYPAKQHAKNVARKLGVSNGLIYLPGQATQPLPDSDQDLPFRQLRYFFYLSGCDEPDCYLTYDIRLDLLNLYITEVSPLQGLWFGPGITREEAAARYDVDTVEYASSLTKDLDSWVKSNGSHSTIYVLHPDSSSLPELSSSARTSAEIDSDSLQVAADACRTIKDHHEISLIRKANQITAYAHTEVLRNLHRFNNEREIEATFLDACISKGVTTQAYHPIAGSGENGSILHYVRNNEPLQGREYVCFDAGCDWNCYASDVTRTFPISGHWPKSKSIYDLVQKMQTECISRVNPGVRFYDLFVLANMIMIDGLKKLGIFKQKPAEEILSSYAARIFLPHGLGHHMGLEVHDVSAKPITAAVQGTLRRTSASHSLPFLESPLRAFREPCTESAALLEEGMVITVEPGIYFSRIAFDNMITPELEEYIDLAVARKYIPVGGIRIEDDILVTRTGHEMLTTAPKGDEALKIIQAGRDECGAA